MQTLDFPRARRARRVTTILIVGIASATLLSGATAQRPGSGWALNPSPDREIKRLYWKELDQTEAWVRITPRAAKGKEPIPAFLVFWVTTRGNASLPFSKKNAPGQIMLDAQAGPLAQVVTPSLAFGTRDKRVDLIASGVATTTSASCPGCASTGIQARLDVATFRALAHPNGLTCEVFGIACALTPEDTRALQEFGRRVGL